MSMILNIDTAVQNASVCLSEKNHVRSIRLNAAQKDHASWLHTAIRDILVENKLPPSGLSAVAVSAGPGSYTGLRVGMSAAKGLCYTLGLPLITLNTLKIMAASATEVTTDLICPMIDARRMEVFTAIYDREGNERLHPTNMILESNSFSMLMEHNTISFFGNGSDKFRGITQHPHASFSMVLTTAEHMVPLSWNCFQKRDWANLAYTEPFYTKDFHSVTKQS
jgi:tRNA threonylcarbamoyladenosine biosynthesis protein TsaB